MISLRPETAADRAAIDEITRLAFGGEDEVDLIARLRAEDAVVVSLVAVEEGAVLGHILFSRLPIESKARNLRGASLAPLTVRPDRQRQGIGSRLTRAGLESCRAANIEAVIVLGHPDYYPRFGFSTDAARRLRAPFSGPAFMALELMPGALARGGRVKYPAAFGLSQG